MAAPVLVVQGAAGGGVWRERGGCGGVLVRWVVGIYGELGFLVEEWKCGDGFGDGVGFGG